MGEKKKKEKDEKWRGKCHSVPTVLRGMRTYSR